MIFLFLFFVVVMGRVGEKAIQTFGLAVPSNDANTGDISQPLNSFLHMREGLKEIQAQVRQSVTMNFFCREGDSLK